jgi:hypothetical protein
MAAASTLGRHDDENPTPPSSAKGLRCRYRVKLRGRARAGTIVSVTMVVAESREEAFLQAVRFEPPMLQDRMELVECDRIEHAAGAARGVESILARFAVPTE